MASASAPPQVYYRFLQTLPSQEQAERFRRDSQWSYDREEKLPDGSLKRSFRCRALSCPFRAYYKLKGGSGEAGGKDGEVMVYVSTKGHNHGENGSGRTPSGAGGSERRMAGMPPKTQVS